MENETGYNKETVDNLIKNLRNIKNNLFRRN